MKPRRHPLSRAGLAAALPVMRDFLTRQRLPAHWADDLARKLIQAYMHAKDEEDVLQTRNFSQTSWLLADMLVGQGRFFYGSSLQLLRQRFPSARKIAKNPQMVWRCESTPSGEILVTRMQDGAPLKRDPLANPKVAELVSIPVGEKVVSKTLTATRGAGSLGSNSKVMARRHLGQPDAQWEVSRTSKRIYITRVK